MDFTDISVRNTVTQDFVYTLIHKSCKIVLDPTYLWSFNELIEQDYIKEKYILTYIIGKDLNNDNNASSALFIEPNAAIICAACVLSSSRISRIVQAPLAAM